MKIFMKSIIKLLSLLKIKEPYHFRLNDKVYSYFLLILFYDYIKNSLLYLKTLVKLFWKLVKSYTLWRFPIRTPVRLFFDIINYY